MTFLQMEEKAILKAQTFELIYAQFDYLYMILPHVSCSMIEPTPNKSNLTNQLIGSLNNKSTQPIPGQYPISYYIPDLTTTFVTMCYIVKCHLYIGRWAEMLQHIFLHGIFSQRIVIATCQSLTTIINVSFSLSTCVDNTCCQCIIVLI